MLYKFTGFRNFFFNFEFTGLVELLELEKKNSIYIQQRIQNF